MAMMISLLRAIKILLREMCKMGFKFFFISTFLSIFMLNARAEGFISPDHKVKISIDCDRDGANCKVSYETRGKSEKLDGIGDNVSVKWSGNTAMVTASCGSPCSTTFFIDHTGLINSYPDVLAVDEKNRCVAYVKEYNAIGFANLGLGKKNEKNYSTNKFKPQPMETSTFLTIVRKAEFKNGHFSVLYLDKSGKQQSKTIKAPCVEM